MNARALLFGCLAACLLGGCAWSNRANRPVWNAFEARLVPEDDTAFYATLPLTVPGGIVAILADTFVVHPAQVADDAWGNAADVWKKTRWPDAYYTELALLPFRALATPIVLVFSFIGRSLFDIPPHGTKEEQAARIEGERRAALLARLAEIAQGRGDATSIELTRMPPPKEWTPELDRAFEEALERGQPLERLALYLLMHRHDLPPWRADRGRGLRDRDPVVRFSVLQQWPRDVAVPVDVKAALLDDPNEAVRQRAHQLWP